MNLIAKPLMMSALFGLWASTAQAAITTQDVVRSFQEAAYTHIEVKEGPTQIKVEGVKDGVKVEVVYDKETGAELKRESEQVGSTVGGSGVEVSTDDEDFTDDNGNDDDSSDDNGSDDDNSGMGGSDDGDDHDAGDDHGGDHSGGDDHGGDHSGGDHDGGSDHDSSDD